MRARIITEDVSRGAPRVLSPLSFLKIGRDAQLLHQAEISWREIGIVLGISKKRAQLLARRYRKNQMKGRALSPDERAAIRARAADALAQ